MALEKRCGFCVSDTMCALQPHLHFLHGAFFAQHASEPSNVLGMLVGAFNHVFYKRHFTAPCCHFRVSASKSCFWVALALMG
jgi:hypothetical protein